MKDFNKKDQVIVKNFLDDLLKLYEKYELTLSHEDTHGGFLIEFDKKYFKDNINWINEALPVSPYRGESSNEGS